MKPWSYKKILAGMPWYTTRYSSSRNATGEMTMKQFILAQFINDDGYRAILKGFNIANGRIAGKPTNSVTLCI
jgi:hypothetical protein